MPDQLPNFFGDGDAQIEARPVVVCGAGQNLSITLEWYEESVN